MWADEPRQPATVQVAQFSRIPILTTKTLEDTTRMVDRAFSKAA